MACSAYDTSTLHVWHRRACDLHCGASSMTCCHCYMRKILFVDVYSTVCTVCTVYCVGITKERTNTLSRKKIQHVWNAIYIDDQWELVDPFWGSGYIQHDTHEFITEFDEFWFCIPPDCLVFTHFPDKNTDLLLDRSISYTQFDNLLRIPPRYWFIGVHICSHFFRRLESTGLTTHYTILYYTVHLSIYPSVHPVHLSSHTLYAHISCVTLRLYDSLLVCCYVGYVHKTKGHEKFKFLGNESVEMSARISDGNSLSDEPQNDFETVSVSYSSNREFTVDVIFPYGGLWFLDIFVRGRSVRNFERFVRYVVTVV